MSRTTFALAVSLCLAAATPALAANWLEIGSDEKGAQIAIDQDALRSQGQVRIVTTRWVLGQSDAERAEVRSVEKYDCARRMLSTVELVTTLRNGDVDRKAWDDDSWEPIEAGSTAEAVLTQVCH